MTNDFEKNIAFHRYERMNECVELLSVALIFIFEWLWLKCLITGYNAKTLWRISMIKMPFR